MLCQKLPQLAPVFCSKSLKRRPVYDFVWKNYLILFPRKEQLHSRFLCTLSPLQKNPLQKNGWRFRVFILKNKKEKFENKNLLKLL